MGVLYISQTNKKQQKNFGIKKVRNLCVVYTRCTSYDVWGDLLYIMEFSNNKRKLQINVDLYILNFFYEEKYVKGVLHGACLSRLEWTKSSEI